MATIVTIDAGDKGRLLSQIWSRVGHHSTSDSVTDIEQESVVLFGGTPTDALAKLRSPLAGNIIVDCSNPPNAAARRFQSSQAEALAQIYPRAQIVKAFNAITADALTFVSKRPGTAIRSVYTSAFYCGGDARTKQVISGLIGEANLDPIDCGPLANAALLENLGLLDSYLQEHGLGPSFAITVVQRPTNRSPLDWLM
jgi:8-hydroxy-5-deazaflavin:NADPH oxidoreductase